MTLAFIVQQMLEVDGHKVMWAGDGAAGYGTYLLFRPDLIITGIEVPDKDGLEMMAHVRAHNPRIGTIYMSADLDRFRPRLEEEKERYQVDFVQKPFSGITVGTKEKTEQGRLIQASGADRQLEVELEAISPGTTRIRTVAKQGVFFKDRATATEIILQTEKILNGA